MKNSNTKTKLSLGLIISLNFTFILLVTGSLIGWFNYSGMRQVLLASTSEIIKRTGESTVSDLLRTYDPVIGFVNTLSHHPIAETSNTTERLKFLPFLRSGLENAESMSAVYIGYEDGSFFLFRILVPGYRPGFTLPEGSKYLVQSIETVLSGETKNLFYFFNEELQEIGTMIPENYDYDPRERDWYKKAKESSNLIKTDPYIFFTTREVGKTFAIQSPSKNSIIGADVTLSAISDSLLKQKITPSTQIVLIDSHKNALAYLDPDKLMIKSEEESKIRLAHINELGVSVLNKIEKKFDPKNEKSNFTVELYENTWYVYASSLPVSGEEVNYLIITAPEDELMESAKESLNKTIIITFALILLSFPVIYLVSRKISKSMRELTKVTNAIRDFDFSGDVPNSSRVKELDELSFTIGIMKNTIQKFLDISSLLSEEKDFEKLMHHILSETAESTKVPAAILYLLSTDEKSLSVGAIYLRDGSAVSIQGAPQVSLEKESETFPILNIIKQNKTSVIRTPSKAFSKEINFFGPEMEKQFPYLIVIPIKNQDKDLIGCLCLFETQDISKNTSRLTFVENLSGTTSVAIQNHRTLEQQKNLFNSLIKSIAKAIDNKSFSKNEHCARVPELAMMLANAVYEQETGPLSNFNYGSDEKEALFIASHLHDIGKIIVPEHVVQKETRLELLYDRLNEIRLRFEIIKRDLKISYYKKLNGGASKELLDRELEKEYRIIDEDFQFIANCNEGKEEMNPENLEKIKKIGMRTWEKTLDDTIGLSYSDKMKKVKKKNPNPLIENLLSDKPDHLIEREEEDIIAPENPWNFKIEAPQYKYNQGEIYNLSLDKGILTPEEKYIINSHMIHTIKILEELPFPKNLKSVPEIAGGHHEKMDGSGFPKKLTKDELSILSRIMGIVDIFETLTSVHKPNKKGRTLSESIKIMDRMRKDDLIDPDIFEVFLTSGSYLEYAKKFLEPYQIDEVDISRYLSGYADV
jgi:HD-GYP domain-containing protein (c-di-GMP phosphodiesterase class II)